ncbi:MAG: iron export ABC transporter permease subunit FetB [Myxococcales bacterium]|nr:iron export ABC transporter permease subunit FetB [Myxococcales bacterium]MCB9579443.1 iron export ABC transporter permease subunit FetB [Polyangiaceae bacterium]
MPDRGAIPLGPGQLAIAAALVVIAGGVSVALRLGLEKKLGVAALRTVVQLLLVGYVLEWVFRIEQPVVLAGVLLVMTAAAGRAAVQRSSRSFAGARLGAFFTLVLTGLSTTFTVTAIIVGVRPWYHAQYVIPLLGMVLGNSLTGVSLALDSLLTDLDEHKDRVEMELSLGATRWEAARDPLSQAVRRGMIPILNSMTVVGIVSLPGMMTGQILEGASPLAAVKYQIVVMFMLAASTSLGSMGVALYVFRRLFNDRHQLRAERITRSKG